MNKKIYPSENELVLSKITGTEKKFVSILNELNCVRENANRLFSEEHSVASRLYGEKNEFNSSIRNAAAALAFIAAPGNQKRSNAILAMGGFSDLVE